MKKYLIIIPLVGLVVYGLIALIRWDPQAKNNTSTNGISTNVRIINGTQYIDLTAKGGYSPKETIAQAGIPTVLQVTTNGTFDCSSAITIPKQQISETLPASGTTEIALGTPSLGPLQGTCSMGMYRFEIDFAV